MNNPPLRRFTIFGLHGYKDVSLEFGSRGKIVVAENGSGKTTILNALNAFLTRRFARLSSLQFDRIECELGGCDATLTVTHEMLVRDRDADGFDEQLVQTAKESGKTVTEIINYVSIEYDGQIESLREHPFPRQIYLSSHHTLESMKSLFDQTKAWLESLPSSLRETIDKVAEALAGTQVLFLPTFRRIEVPLVKKNRSSRDPISSRVYRNDQASQKPILSGANFGLSDVEAKLAELADSIGRRSNAGYRAATATIVQDLITKSTTDWAARSASLPSVADFALFLSRVSPRAGKQSALSGLADLYESGGIDDDHNSFLRFFLSRLNGVILQTRHMEQTIETFVEVCNDYLKMSSDEKELSYDQETMRVVVRNLWTGLNVDLDDLSSGEKQIISLMAALYLEPAEKIVLIDEPELSLSLDWQRRVLVDVLKPDSVVQMLAITHSPFVFDNELDHLAEPLKIARRRSLL